jgi:hypothetical protein
MVSWFPVSVSSVCSMVSWFPVSVSSVCSMVSWFPVSVSSVLDLRLHGHNSDYKNPQRQTFLFLFLFCTHNTRKIVGIVTSKKVDKTPVKVKDFNGIWFINWIVTSNKVDLRKVILEKIWIVTSTVNPFFFTPGVLLLFSYSIYFFFPKLSLYINFFNIELVKNFAL